MSLSHRLARLSLVAALLLSGCMARQMPSAAAAAPTAAALPSDTLAAVRARGTLRVGLALFVPWSTHDRNGHLIGFDIDVARRLAADLGVQPVFVLTSWSDLVGDLERGRYDIIVSGLAITPERALAVSFSAPYNAADVMLVVNQRAAGRRRGRSAFDDAAVRLGVRGGTIAESLAAQRFPRAALVRFDSDDVALAALLAGTITGLVADSPLPEFAFAMHRDALALPGPPLARLDEGFAVRHDNADFVGFLNAWIRYNTGTGWLRERRAYWFDLQRWSDQL
ncbi:MAG: transporter substrate-binding domain-containing protein [bacterium]